MYESFVRYQTRLIRALDSMAKKYNFTVLDASQPAEKIFAELQGLISSGPLRHVRQAGRRARRTARVNGGA
jgi:hypothetical protein